jgi:oligopeptide transport system substrate-binding protein
MKKTIWGDAIVLAVFLLFFGFPSANFAIAADKSANFLNVQVDVEISALDYHSTSESNALEAMSAIGEGLYRMDAKGIPQLALAKEAIVSDGGLTITYTLKDTFWQDGITPVTASDFVYSWRRLVDPAIASEFNFLEEVAAIKNSSEIIAGEKSLDALGVKAIDSKTLRVTLTSPVPYISTLFAIPAFFPLNEAFVKAQGDSYGTSPKTLLTNGPFIASSFEPNANSVELIKNPNYYDADAVKLDGIKYRTVKDPQQAALSYRNGELDIVKLAGEQVELFKDDSEYHVYLSGYLWMITPNHKIPTFANLNLRMALAKAFDKEALCRNVLKNGSTAANYFVPPGIAIDSDGKDFRDSTGLYLLTDKYSALDHWKKAKKELGITNLTVTLILEDSDMAINIGQFVQAQIQETLPGLTFKLEPMPKKSQIDRSAQGDFELRLHRWGPDYADPLTFLDLWTSSQHYSWSNAEYDAIIKSARSGPLASDTKKRWNALQSAEKIVGDNAVTFPVFLQGESLLVKKNVRGVEFRFSVDVTSYKNAVKQ